MAMAAAKPRKLRSGFTTGTAAAAAAKGALLALLDSTPPKKVGITFLTGTQTEIALHSVKVENSRCAVASVIKDAGDDPDVTHMAEVGARVELLPEHKGPKIIITGGQGVGTITKPGLEISPGNAAINPGPLRMITNEVLEVLDRYRCRKNVAVEVFVPKGEELARKTLNARLGIIGGLSILGTTGIERPMSHEAYLATIDKALAVARACGLTEVVLTTGRRSERFAQQLWPQKTEESFVQIGDFFKTSLEMAAARKFSNITVVVFFGKAVKMAQGTPHTHAAKSNLTLSRLADWTKASSGDKVAEKIRQAYTARHAFDLLKDDHPQVIIKVAREVYTWAKRFAGSRLNVKVVILNYDGNIVAVQPDEAKIKKEKM